MVACKFFLQGYCRYGANCRFEHVYPRQQYTYINPSTSTNPNPANKPAEKTVDDQTIINSVIKDVKESLSGHQWLLTVYGPFKEKSNLPGFVDYSFEETRHAFYEGLKTGTNAQIAQNFNMLTQTCRQSFEALLNPLPDMKQTIIALYRNANPNGANAKRQLPFGTSAGQNSFGFNAEANSFGNTFPSNAPFAAPNTPTFSFLSSQPAQPIFGGSPATPMVSFSFQQPPTSKSLFGDSTQSTFPQQAPIFGSTFNQFPSPNLPQTNVFALANQTQQNANFVEGMDGMNQTGDNQGFFAATSNPGSYQQQRQTVTSQSSPAENVGDFKGSQQTDAYSVLEQLSAEDLRAFTEPNFLCGLIPECPPTKEMCF